jgi:hypothetical protein
LVALADDTAVTHAGDRRVCVALGVGRRSVPALAAGGGHEVRCEGIHEERIHPIRLLGPPSRRRSQCTHRRKAVENYVLATRVLASLDDLDRRTAP